MSKMNASEAREKVVPRPDGLCWWGSGECMKPQTMRSFYCVDHEGPRKPATVESGAGDGEKCKCGHAKEDHREDVFECLAANVVDGVDEECQCDDFEPAKPESGDGLLNEVKGHYHTLKFLNDALLATKDSQQRHAYRIAEVATDQIKSALKENERLRGLLERACIVLSSGIVGMPEEVRREARMVVREYIKAAVTGEQP